MQALFVFITEVPKIVVSFRSGIMTKREETLFIFRNADR